ncbi:MAG: hypothetical protein HY556_01575 [Euryarchaeota archaeon]|nr:hypothetical protein [Euryarchaeota archaeon]
MKAGTRRWIRSGLVLALLWLGGASNAHVESFSEAKSLSAGPYAVFVDVYPAPVFRGTLTSVSAFVTKNGPSGLDADLNITLQMVLPGKVNETLSFERQSPTVFGAFWRTEWPGPYVGTLTLEANRTKYVLDTNFTVYPELGFRIRPANPSLDSSTNKTVGLAFEVMNASTGARSDPFTDVKVRFEHWSDDHSVLVDVDDSSLAREETGLWSVDKVFRTGGMYHMRFSSESGRFDYSDTPILHLYALDPLPGSEEKKAETDRQTPGATGLYPLLVGLGAAIALSAFAKRRRPDSP